MNKLYALAVAALFGTAAMAQVDVTFRVDMNGQTVSPNGVHVAGNFQEAAGFPGDWNPATAQLTDANSDGIYELTVNIPAGQYEYKFLNGNDWPFEENVPDLNRKDGTSNRFLAVTDWHAANGGWVMPANLFGGSAPAGRVGVRLQVDMSAENVSDNGIHVAGDAFVPNWEPEFAAATESSNNRYAYVTHVAPNSSYTYAWVNGTDLAIESESVPNACGDGGLRMLTVGTTDVIAPALCFSSCESCALPSTVIFRVDLNGAGDISPDGAYIAGTFNGWSGVAMNDDGDGKFSISYELEPGTVQWKFQNGPDGWEPNLTGLPCASGNDRVFTVVESATPLEVGIFCFGTCDAECEGTPEPANITFRVDMNAESVSPDGVWFIGSVTSPAWQQGAVQMTDTDGDGVYETTLLVGGPATFNYKYVNGNVHVTTNEEFDGFTEQLSCNVSSGVGGWNRIHTRTGEAEVITIVPFNGCGELSTGSTASLGAVNIYPNPSNGSTFVDIENPNGYNLRMSIIDVTGKIVRENIVFNNGRKEINTSGFAPGIYFLNVVNEKSERQVYKLMVR